MHPRKQEPRRAHTLPPTTPLVQQVGGHTGVHVTECGSLLLKPALLREVAFYQLIRDVTDFSDPSLSPKDSLAYARGVHALRNWMPGFIGLLSYEGKVVDDQDPAGVAPTADDNMARPPEVSSQTIVLENLLYGYCKPCVLDVKLGPVLHDEDAPEEKKARMIQKAVRTTSFETGVRLTGFQVYSNHSPDPIVYGREYGYELRVDQLSDGIRNFFPCSSTVAPSPETTNTSNKDTVGLPVYTLLSLLTSLHASLIELRMVLAGAHIRVIGGSVLIIYEGDWERAVAACGRGGGPGTLDPDSEDDDGDDDDVSDNDMDDEMEVGEQMHVEVDERGRVIMEPLASSPGQRSSSETRSSNSSSSSLSDSNPQPRLYTVAFIDFAHSRVVPGQGPDQGLLKGMDTLIKLVDRRRQEVVAIAATASLQEVEAATAVQ